MTMVPLYHADTSVAFYNLLIVCNDTDGNLLCKTSFQVVVFVPVSHPSDGETFPRVLGILVPGEGFLDVISMFKIFLLSWSFPYYSTFCFRIVFGVSGLLRHGYKVMYTYTYTHTHVYTYRGLRLKKLGFFFFVIPFKI